MDIRIGDRFERILPTSQQKHSIWECNGNECGVCVLSTNEEWPVGRFDLWNFSDNYGWKFIGNYTKSENFSNLYSILSDNDIL